MRGSTALLLLGVAGLGLRLAGSEDHVEQLRDELRTVYAEAEALRTTAVQSQQRVDLLEQQLRQLRAERETLLRKLQDLGEERRPAPRPRARRPRTPSRSGSAPAAR